MRNRHNIEKSRGDVALASGEIITLRNDFIKTFELKENKGQSQSQGSQQPCCCTISIVFLNRLFREMERHAAANNHDCTDEKWRRHRKVLQPIGAAFTDDERTGERGKHHRHAHHGKQQQ